MWSIAHQQGIRLPSKDYWQFVELITVSHPDKVNNLAEYDQIFRWTELIQSSPLAIERSVYEVIGGAYRKCNITTLELRFNPMKRNREGEQDLDHIISAAIRGQDRALLEYPQMRAGLILMMDRTFPLELNAIIVEKALRYRGRGIIGIDIAGPPNPDFSYRAHAGLVDRARDAGLGVTIHSGEEGRVEDMWEVVDYLRPDRIGHGILCAYDERLMERGARGHRAGGLPNLESAHPRRTRCSPRCATSSTTLRATRRPLHHQHRRPRYAGHRSHPGVSVPAAATASSPDADVRAAFRPPSTPASSRAAAASRPREIRSCDKRRDNGKRSA